MARVERGAPVTAERGGGRGRRDPALRARIQNDQPVYTDDTPDGVVAVRGPERGAATPPDSALGQEIDLSQLSDEEYQALVDSRVIDNGDEGVIELDNETIAAIWGDEGVEGENELNEFSLLSPGDVVYAKVHHPMRFDDEPSNFSYGVASRIQDGESEEEAFERISLIVNTRALDLAKAAMEPVMQFKDDVARERRERLNGRGGLRPRQEEQQ